MKKRPSTPFTGSSVPAILVTLCLLESPAFAADYFHLGGIDGSRIPDATQYSNTNGSTTLALVAPGPGDNLFLYNSTVAGAFNQRLELGASNKIFNSLTFGSNAGTTQIDRGASPGSTAGNILGLNAGGITVASGAGPVTFGRLANSGNNQRVIVGVYQDLTVANNSSNDLTFNREFDGRGTAQRTVTVAGSGDGDTIFKQILSYDTARDLAMTINKTSGSGVVRFDGTNTYTGATTVAAGKLKVNGSTSASSAVGVSSGGTLAGSGTVGGNVTLASGGTLAPGNSPGVLTVSGSTTFSSGSMFEWEIDTAKTNPETNRGTAYDGINTTSVIGSGAIFKIMLTGSQTFSDSFWNQTRTWTDIFKSADGSTTLSDWAAVFSGGFQYAYNGTTLEPTNSGSFTLSGNSLTWSAVPEPSNLLAGMFAASAMLRRRRRS